MKRYTFTRLLATTILLFAISSGCKEDEEPILSAPAVLAIQNANEKPIEISLFEPDVQILSIRAVAQSKSNQNITVTFKIDRTLVDTYNKANGTSYEIVPAEAYELSKAEVILPRYNEVSSTAKLTLSSIKMPAGEQYLLPITIDEIRGDELAQQSTTNNAYYILFQKRVVPPPVILDRTNWIIPYVSSELQVGESPIPDLTTGWVEDLLDGNMDSYWSTNGATDKPPFYIVFDLGEEVTVRGVKISHRKNIETQYADAVTMRVPGDFVIETAKTITGDGMSDDGEWTYEQSHITLKDALQESRLSTTVYLTTPQRARYIRFTLNKTFWNDTSWSPSPNYGGSFAEFDVWGNVEEIEFE